MEYVCLTYVTQAQDGDIFSHSWEKIGIFIELDETCIKLKASFDHTHKKNNISIEFPLNGIVRFKGIEQI